MKPSDLLDLIKAAYGLTSDYQVMKRFGFSQTGISSWRTNRSFPEDKILVRFADVLDINLGVLVLHSMIWRKKDPEIRRSLEKVLEALAYCENSEILD
ncbi:hypothetical protein [Shewanella algae]|uniref:hypothetical protein n=1 Tax=Shewanella algae TaxID=38313 RepID=UPI0031F50EDE